MTRDFIPGSTLTITPEDLVASLQSDAVWLDGGGGRSIVTWGPREVAVNENDWEDAGRRLSAGAPAGEPFAGGVVGSVAYDGRRSWLARVEGAAIYSDGTWTIDGSPSFRAQARRALERAVPLPPAPPAPALRSVRTMDQAVYEGRVRRILAWIAEGDCYQVNLSRAVVAEGVGDPFVAYRRLSHLARAPYAAWLRPSPEYAVLSASPELLLAADGERVWSEPIKGTRPRHGDPVADRALAGELRTSEKDLAELVMIVDLVRNDLGRVARTGSVTWEKRRVTAHANVHHASQIVRATLGDGQDSWAALGALFPAGSITGAPKIRACQRIAEVEDEPRGLYCGTIGFTGGRTARWNVAIRTAEWSPAAGGTLTWHVGGGIVADSDPTEEWKETVAKGTTMARAFGDVSDEGRLPSYSRQQGSFCS